MCASSSTTTVTEPGSSLRTISPRSLGITATPVSSTILGGYPQISTVLSTGTVLDPGDELVDLVEHQQLLRELTANLVARVHDRGVVATAEDLGDLGIAVVRELTEDVHARLPGV